MNLHIAFKQMDPSDALKQFIEEKCQTLDKYFNGRISVTWHIYTNKLNRVAHCHLLGNNMDFFGEGVSDDFKAAIDMAFDKIEKQLRKHKEIVKDHLHRNGHRASA